MKNSNSPRRAVRTRSKSSHPSNHRRRIGWFETLESRLLLSASSIDGRPYIDLGPSDNVALDQPRITVQLITPTDQIIGPDTFNDWLLDTGANTILTFQSAVDDMNSAPPVYETSGTFEEIGVGGSSLYDISKPYRFDFAGRSGERNTLTNARIISDPTRDLSLFGPHGIVGMPAMTQRVTTLDFTTLTDINEFSMNTQFSTAVPSTTNPRYSVALDDRVSFTPDGSVKSGGFPPVWADLPFLTGQLKHNDLVATGNMLFDTGAQVSILSSAMALSLGLDSNLDGVLDSKDANFAREETIGGIGGLTTVPVFLIDQLHIPTLQGADLVWTDLQWLILDIIPGIDAVFGSDNNTSGWLEAFFGNGLSGYVKKIHLDFLNWEATGQGTAFYDINPDIFAIVDPNGPGAVITESGEATTVSETGINDTYQLALNKAPAANVRVSLVAATGSQVTAVNAAIPANAFLDFTPSNWNVPQTVRVSAVDDSAVESFHRSYVKHVSTSTDANYQNAGMPRVIVNVIDNDFAGVMIIPTNGATNVAEGGATDTYQLVLTNPPTQPVTIELENVQNQVRAVAAVGGASSVTFTANNWNVPQSVLVTAIDDTIVEGAHKSYITHRFTTTDTNYQEAFALQELAYITDNELDSTPPRITDVIVGSTFWSAGFLDAVDGSGVGAGNKKGLSLLGSSQLRNLSQNNINKLYIKFNENVSASFTSAKVSLSGTNFSNYMSVATVAYGVDGVDIATITLPSPIGNDALRLSILDTLTDAAGNRLDGEWLDGVSTLSGNGTGTGQFNFRIDVQPGDVNDSNGVNSTDLLATHGKNGTVISTLADAYFDINGNGGVNSTDLLLAHSLNGSVLPAAPGGSSLIAAAKSEAGGGLSSWISTLGTLSQDSNTIRSRDFLLEERKKLVQVNSVRSDLLADEEFNIPMMSNLLAVVVVPVELNTEFLVLPDHPAFSFENFQFISKSWTLSDARDLRLPDGLFNLNIELFQSNQNHPSKLDLHFFDAGTKTRLSSNLIVDQLIIEIADDLDETLASLSWQYSQH